MTIYFIRECREGGCIKIGYTNENGLWLRLCQLQVGNPNRLEIMGIIPGATVAEEVNLHKRFRQNRLMGEWFLPSDDILRLIENETETPTPPVKRSGYSSNEGFDCDFWLHVTTDSLRHYMEEGGRVGVVVEEGDMIITLYGITPDDERVHEKFAERVAEAEAVTP